MTNAGLIVTMSMPLSFKNFQAHSSASVLDNGYHNWQETRTLENWASFVLIAIQCQKDELKPNENKLRF